MKSLKLVVIAAAAIAVAGPAFAGRDGVQIMQQEQAVKKLRAQQAAEKEKSRAGAVGPQGQVGPSTQRGPAAYNIGHPTERVRR